MWQLRQIGGTTGVACISRQLTSSFLISVQSPINLSKEGEESESDVARLGSKLELKSKSSKGRDELEKFDSPRDC